MNQNNIQCIFLALVITACFGTADLGARKVETGPDETIEVRARVRFATVVVLPEDEQILDWVCGDAEYWSVQGSANLAFVKPSATGLSTNVTLVTDKGNVYTLLFREVGKEKVQTDLKVVLQPKAGDSRNRSAPLKTLRFEPRGAAERHEQEAARARQQAVDAERKAKEQIEADRERFRSSYPSTLRFDYRFGRQRGRDPFHVEAIWRDDRFTYIRADPEEVPALYEERDGKPSLVPYEFSDGLYVTRRLLGDGWLQIGERRLTFQRLRP